MLQRLGVPPGATLAQAEQRLTAPSFWLPTLSADGAVLASSSHATITATASATPHTKGSWVEVVSALAADSTLLAITLTTATGVSANITSTLLDIGVGAGGSEVVAVADLAVGYQVAASTFRIPVLLRAGERVAVRCQGAVVSQQVLARYAFWQLPHGRRPSRTVVTMGGPSMATTSRGVDIAGDGSTNTKSAWTEIVAATAEPFGAIIPCVQGGGDLNFTAGQGILDIGVGAAGAERIVHPDIALMFSSAENIMYDPSPFRGPIPTGSRLSARWARDNANNSIDVTLYGVRI